MMAFGKVMKWFCPGNVHLGEMSPKPHMRVHRPSTTHLKPVSTHFNVHIVTDFRHPRDQLELGVGGGR